MKKLWLIPIMLLFIVSSSLAYNVTSCQSIITPGYYEILNDITIDSNPCISIQTDDVILNGNGYSLIGNFSWSGIEISSHSNITIENLTIKNVDNAIIGTANNSVISFVNVYNVTDSAGHGGIILRGYYNLISNNYIDLNTTTTSDMYTDIAGVHYYSYAGQAVGIEVSNGEYITISNNYITHAPGRAISLYANSTDIYIYNNTIEYSSLIFWGDRVSSLNDYTIGKNQNISIIGNDFYGNGFGGLAEGSNGWNIINNTIYGRTGIVIVGYSQTTGNHLIEGNNITVAITGISMYPHDSGAIIENITIKDNIINDLGRSLSPLGYLIAPIQFFTWNGGERYRNFTITNNTIWGGNVGLSIIYMLSGSLEDVFSCNNTIMYKPAYSVFLTEDGGATTNGRIENVMFIDSDSCSPNTVTEASSIPQLRGYNPSSISIPVRIRVKSNLINVSEDSYYISVDPFSQVSVSSDDMNPSQITLSSIPTYSYILKHNVDEEYSFVIDGSISKEGNFNSVLRVFGSNVVIPILVFSKSMFYVKFLIVLSLWSILVYKLSTSKDMTESLVIAAIMMSFISIIWVIM